MAGNTLDALHEQGQRLDRVEGDLYEVGLIGRLPCCHTSAADMVWGQLLQDKHCECCASRRPLSRCSPAQGPALSQTSLKLQCRHSLAASRPMLQVPCCAVPCCPACEVLGRWLAHDACTAD